MFSIVLVWHLCGVAAEDDPPGLCALARHQAGATEIQWTQWDDTAGLDRPRSGQPETISELDSSYIEKGFIRSYLIPIVGGCIPCFFSHHVSFLRINPYPCVELT